jgi:regulator of nonsense transcripts 2
LQFYKELNVNADQKKFFKKALNSYYDAVAELLQSEHAVTHSFFLSNLDTLTCHLFEFPLIYSCINQTICCTQSLHLMEAENAKVLSAKGELSDESTASYEKLRKSFDQLLRGVSL